MQFTYYFLRWWFKPRLLDSYFEVDEAKFYELKYVGKHSSEISLEDIPNAVAEMKTVFRSNITRRVSNRKPQLQRLMSLLEENEDKITAAIKADLGRCEMMGIPFVCTISEFIE